MAFPELSIIEIHGQRPSGDTNSTCRISLSGDVGLKVRTAVEQREQDNRSLSP